MGLPILILTIALLTGPAWLGQQLGTALGHFLLAAGLR